MNVGEVFSVEAFSRFLALRHSALPSRGVLDLARGWRPRRSVYGRRRCSRGLGFAQGVWTGDGSVSIDTRQRRRRAARAAAREAGRERVAGVRASQLQIERDRYEAEMSTIGGQVGVARRAMDWKGGV